MVYLEVVNTYLKWVVQDTISLLRNWAADINGGRYILNLYKKKVFIEFAVVDWVNNF